MNTLRNGQSGQAMVEGVIGLALMCMVLTLAAILSHMYINRIRALEASRHAAWIVGNGGMLELSKNKKIFDEKFFFDDRFVKWKHKQDKKDDEGKRVRRSEQETITDDSDLLELPKSWTKVKVYHDTVTYGMGKLALKATPARLLPFPFVYFKSDLPILGGDDRAGRGGDDDKGLIKTLGQVEGLTCWPDVKDSKLEAASIQGAVLDEYFHLVKDNM